MLEAGHRNRPQMTLSPALAVLRATHGDRIPDGRLGAETVPPAVLSLPIEIAIEELVKHAKECPNLDCGHVPPPLGYRRGMRPDRFRTARQEVNRLLWKYPDHDLVDFIRSNIRRENKELVDQISTGSLLESETLSGLLQDRRGGLRRLAAVLWASEFDGPDAEELFRLLVPLADAEFASGFSLENARVEEEKKLRRELRKTSRAYRETKRNSERSEKSLQRRERDLEKLRGEYQEEKKEHRKAVEDLERVREQMRQSDAARTSLERDLDKVEKIREDVQREHRRLDREKRELAAERSDLARQLQTKELRVKELESELGDLPRDDEAVQQFLRVEEERIKRDRLILSGSPKVQADEEWRLHRKLKSAFLEAYPRFRAAAPKKKLPRKSYLRFHALGGSAEIGRSCYLLELGDHRILVDCGIKPGGFSGFHPPIDGLERIDAVIVTHAHTDHVGWIPALVNRFGEPAIYCTHGTKALFPAMLEDCHTRYTRQLATRSEQAKHIANAEEIVAGYGRDDVLRVPQLAVACEFGSEQALPFPGISFRFFPAGHILGAASFLIEEETGRRVFFSGDFSSFPQLTVPAASWPEDLGEIDLFILESTYGNSKHQEPETTRAELVDFVRDTTENRKGSVILPSFALGRAQELLKLILKGKEEGDLREDVPVFVDGMIKSINPIYQEHADFDLPLDAVLEVRGEADRDEVARQAQKVPSIIVTTSGMLTGGPVVEYARHLLPDARHRIVLTGYQDEGAPSRALLDISGAGGPRVVRLPGEGGEIRFKAAMPAKQFGLSAHADRPGLLEYASRLKPKQIALVHGAPWQQQDLSKGLALNHPGAVISCGPDQVEVG